MTLPRRLLLSSVAILFLFAARQRAVRHPSTPSLDQPLRDVFSFSEPRRVAVRHVALDLTVDFDARVLRGSATLDIDNLVQTRSLVLDTQFLTITRVTSDGQPLAYTLGAEDEYGAPLTIALRPSTTKVTIEYSTSPSAPGLFWNTAAQSYGRVQPYLYSLNEPVGARSWIPIQDTPAARMTYEATLRVPPTHLALMSAGDNPRATNTTGVYSFTMTQTIPAYLIALAVGRIEYQPFDSRTGVYAEPELLDDAAWELQYLPAMMAAAEKILGPHPFPRHDVLLMPPTFGFGGMEHPMLNFINPFSVVSGNHPAQPDPKILIAHELAHSWAGDATTLSTWNDVWLNEGITSYLTLRIIEEVSGTERAELSYFFDRSSYENFARSTTKPQTTVLHRQVEFPWTGFGFTSYTKGELFLRTLEDVLGRAALDAFLRDYFARFAFRWADDRNFVALLGEHAGIGAIENAQVMEWIYAPGVPANLSAPQSSALYDRVQARVNAFVASNTLSPAGWTDFERELFINSLPSTVIRDRAATLDSALGLSFQTTPPIRFVLSAITYAPLDAAIERLLMRGGPNGTIIQLYSALAVTGAGIQRAREIFAIARERYSADVAARVETILAVSNAATPVAAFQRTA